MPKLKRLWLIILITSVTACMQIKQKPDGPARKNLPKLAKNYTINPEWEADLGEGVGITDNPLSFSRYKNSLISIDNTGFLLKISVSGNKLASYQIENEEILSGPFVADKYAIVFAKSGKAYAVDLNSMQLAWTTDINSEVVSGVAIDANRLYVNALNGSLTALNLTNGRQLWRYSGSLPSLMLRKGSTPLVYKDLVICGFSTGRVIAFDAIEGRVIWSNQVVIPSGDTDIQRMVDIAVSPKVINNKIYVSSYQGASYALSLSSGQIKYEYDANALNDFVVEDEKIIITTTDGDIKKIDAQSGEILWHQDKLQGRRLTSPVLIKDYIAFGDDEGYLHFLDKKGIIVGRFFADKSGIEASPIVHKGKIFALGASGKLFAIDFNKKVFN